VDRLSYSAHPTAHRIMSDVVSELVTEHAGEARQHVGIWAAHRTGMLDVGDPALVCAVSAAHRGQAFAVCSELVDPTSTPTSPPSSGQASAEARANPLQKQPTSSSSFGAFRPTRETESTAEMPSPSVVSCNCGSLAIAV
jgi:hypothetical protein